MSGPWDTTTNFFFSGPNELIRLLIVSADYYSITVFLKKNLNASRPSEHPTQGENVKTLRWVHRLQRLNIFMVFIRVPR